MNIYYFYITDVTDINCNAFINEFESFDIDLFNVHRIDIIKNPDIVKRYNVSVTPSLYLVNDGAVISSLLFPQSLNQITDWLLEYS